MKKTLGIDNRQRIAKRIGKKPLVYVTFALPRRHKRLLRELCRQLGTNPSEFSREMTAYTILGTTLKPELHEAVDQLVNPSRAV